MNTEPMIDIDLLQKIVTEVALNRLSVEIRELIVYSGNKDLCEIYSRYLDEIKKQKEETDD